MQNPGVLDHRIPVCSDPPFIDTSIVQIPDPGQRSRCTVPERLRKLVERYRRRGVAGIAVAINGETFLDEAQEMPSGARVFPLSRVQGG